MTSVRAIVPSANITATPWERPDTFENFLRVAQFFPARVATSVLRSVLFALHRPQTQPSAATFVYFGAFLGSPPALLIWDSRVRLSFWLLQSRYACSAEMTSTLVWSFLHETTMQVRPVAAWNTQVAALMPTLPEGPSQSVLPLGAFADYLEVFSSLYEVLTSV